MAMGHYAGKQGNKGTKQFFRVTFCIFVHQVGLCVHPRITEYSPYNRCSWGMEGELCSVEQNKAYAV